MKLAIIHFNQPVTICGAFSPKSLNMKAVGDRQFITSMELDMENRVVWLETNGQRTPKDMQGRLCVPFERVVIAVPLKEAAMTEKPKAKVA